MPKTLVEKITECCAGVNNLLKEGDNGEYAYLRILDIANALREKLFAAGVLIIPSDVECAVTDGSLVEVGPPERRYTCATVKTEFTMTDGVDVLNGILAYGYARDLDGKCVAIAQTAALKSFLKRLALIFGEYDDPEIPQRGPWKSKEQIKDEWKDVPAKNAEVLAAKRKTSE